MIPVVPPFVEPLFPPVPLVAVVPPVPFVAVVPVEDVVPPVAVVPVLVAVVPVVVFVVPVEAVVPIPQPPIMMISPVSGSKTNVQGSLGLFRTLIEPPLDRIPIAASKTTA